MENKKIKVVYILPFYEEGTDTHLFYNYELIKKLTAREELDLFVIIEKCQKLTLEQVKAVLGLTNCYIQKFQFLPLRFFELLFWCFGLCVQGYKNFYVHYSYYGAFTTRLVSILWRFNLHRDVQPLKIFYWNRGMPWLFERGWLEEKIFRLILRHTILVTGPKSLVLEYQKHYGVKEYRVLSNWVDVTRFLPDLRKTKTQIFQDLAQSRKRDEQRNSPAGEYSCLEKFVASADTRIVLFVHHLSERKGADLVPEIAKAFGDDVLFLMIGDGPEFENCKLKIENLGLKNVKLLGKLPNADLPAYFHITDIFLMPSREEGSPHVLLEAMASGVPFVASDVGGVRELIPGGTDEFLCKSEEVGCFQNKIKTLLNDKALYDKARNDGFAHVKKFDISLGTEEFIELFK